MNGKEEGLQVKNDVSGAVYGIIAYTVWGLLPIYWKLLGEIPADEILAHRIFWAFLFVGGLFLSKNDIGVLKEAIKERKNIRNN